MKMLKVLELFSGYGSQALALENLGIEFTSDISEIDKYAIQAYEQIHGKTHNWGDITKINEKELPYYDLITYSSPCQDFSVAGLGKGGDVWEDKNGYKVIIVKTMFSYAEGVSENYIHRLIFRHGFGRGSDDNFDDCDYLGKSKANIDDLFKTENE